MRIPHATALLCGIILLLDCREPSHAATPAAAPTPTAPRVAPKPKEALYTGALASGWLDYGWSTRSIGKGPAKVDLSEYGGWILGKPHTPASFGGLRFRTTAGPGELEVRFDAASRFPRITPGEAHQVGSAPPWREYFIPMSELDPGKKPFDQLVFQGKLKGKLEGVLFDEISLTEEEAEKPIDASTPKKEVKLAVFCGGKTRPISPQIYGVALDVQRLQDETPYEYGVTIRRWGGNSNSRYNWKLGNAWNAGADWYFHNFDATGGKGSGFDTFNELQHKHGVQTALTIPMLGWVARDTTSVGFPLAAFPDQKTIDPYDATAGTGKDSNGALITPGPPTLTSVAAPPEFMQKWVETLRAGDKDRGRSVHLYFLDNEPNLWSQTHRDVHPRPLTYDELLDRTIAYARVIRKADPQAVIAGPCEWGWTNYFNSMADSSTSTFLRPDRRAHGDVPLVPWYLKKLAEHKKKTGESLLDVLDLHFYPQEGSIGINSDGEIGPEASALRLRTTRALWDPTYADETWIKEAVRLLPRMQEWIDENYPGLGISIGEYSFGADTHPSGGLAQAEALGRFGQYGVTAAFVWYYPPKGSAGAQAFAAYRNYDGKGAHFLDTSVPTRTSGPVSLFASRDDKTLVLVALNLDPTAAAAGALDLGSCGEAVTQRVFQTTFSSKGLLPIEQDLSQLVLPPWSITVFELALKQKTP